MKERLIRTISIMICILMMTASIPMLAFAADTTSGKTNTPFNYVALGDASTTGYGMTAKTGYGIAAAGTFPVLIRNAIAKNQFKVTLDQLGMGGMRVEDLRYLLDDSYSEDPYMKEKFPDLANYREKYRAAIQNADLITYGLGSVDLGSYLLYVAADPEKNCCDDEVKNLVASDPEGIKQSLDNALAGEVNKLKGTTLGSLAGSRLDSLVNQFSGAYIDAAAYTFYSFCLNYDKTVELIKQLNPDVDIIALNINNMLGNISINVLGAVIELGKLYSDQIVAKANQYMQRNTNIKQVIDITDIQRFLDEAAAYDGNPDSLSKQMKDYFDIYEDDLLLKKAMDALLSKASLSKKTAGYKAGYDTAGIVLRELATIAQPMDIGLKASDIVDLMDENSRAEFAAKVSAMGKTSLADLKTVSLYSARIKGILNDGKDYLKNVDWFINKVTLYEINGKRYHLYGDDIKYRPICKIIMAFGMRVQMGNGFFQQPSAKGHVQIKDKVLAAYADKYLHLDTSIEPACETAGVKNEFWQNVVSGKCYSDEAHTTEVSKADYTIPPLGHKWGSWKVTRKAAFCKDGVKTSTCSVCGATKTAAIKGLGPAKTRIIKRIGRRKSFTIKWKKPTAKNLKKTTGYQIRYSLKKTMKNSKSVLVKKNKTTSKTFKKLKAKKKYWVQIRTYKLSGGRKYFSGWSVKKYVKTK